MSRAYEQIVKLKPTKEEIQAYADQPEEEGRDYGVVTYSKSKKPLEDWCFIRFHDTWKQKSGGRIHIDVGYVDEKYVDERNVPDTTHLMLDRDPAPEFVNFIKEIRRKHAVTPSDSDSPF